MSATEILLSLFVINLGIVTSAGIYETRIVLPLWFSKLPGGNYAVNMENMQQIDTGRKFWGFASTVPLTLLMITNLVFAIKAQAPLHNYWLAASLLVFVERFSTFLFFIPTAIKLAKPGKLPAEKISGLVSTWLKFNNIRVALTFIALLFSIKALLLIGSTLS